MTSVLALIIGFGIIGWTGLYIDMSTAMIAVILTFACSIAYNIHLYNFFKTRFVETGKRKISVTEAMAETGWGVLLSGLTTIADVPVNGDCSDESHRYQYFFVSFICTRHLSVCHPCCAFVRQGRHSVSQYVEKF